MRHLTRTAVLFFCLTVLTTGIAMATDGEWTSSVDAAEAVDPSLTPPPVANTDVSVVGGGRLSEGQAAFPNFAFSASSRNGDVSGRLTLINGYGQKKSATVVCIAASVDQSGRGGIASLIGRLDEPASGIYPTMIFYVSDIDQTSGSGDSFTAQFSDLPPLEYPCVPQSGGSSVANGNIAIRSLN